MSVLLRLGNAAALAFRLTAAALLALWLADRLKVALPLWSVLTALVGHESMRLGRTCTSRQALGNFPKSPMRFSAS